MTSLTSLTHAVQAHNGRFWETIAAFNVDSIAIKYAKECSCSNKVLFKYRVVQTADDKVLWEE